ncbi:MAG: LytTR family DNA-binding domain-containing protein [Moraxellaceae bacterium]|nr:LytTR family DNA-binding domain-containing protein [Moraxellaceae bacterium]
MNRLNILVADDEPLARRRLVRLLHKLEWVGDIDEAADVAEARLKLAEARPDVLLLDIQMPGGDGFAVLDQLQCEPPCIVFVTAFDHHALRAFEVNAIDYLTKPIDAARFNQAMERARQAVASRGHADRVAELQEVVAALKRALKQQPKPAGELWVKVRGEHIRIPQEKIIRIQAERDYVRIHLPDAEYLHHETLNALEQRLNPDDFIRIHRGTILRRNAIIRLKPAPFAALIAQLADGTECRVGRTYAPTLRGLLGKR